MQSVETAGLEPPRSGKLETITTIVFLAAVAIFAANGVGSRGFGATLGSALVATALYPVVLAHIARAAGSPMGAPAIGAVLPAAAAVVVGVQAPYTWRDVVAPVVIGLAALVGSWIAGSMLRSQIGRRVLRLYVLLVLVIGGLGIGFVGLLFVTSNAAPF